MERRTVWESLASSVKDPEPRHWFLAPLYVRQAGIAVIVTPEGVAMGDHETHKECPGTGDPLQPYEPPGMICHCHNLVDNTVLVGFIEERQYYAAKDWTPLTLEEARDHFKASTGRSPTSFEVC